jgi:small subunit ribosomal protein S17e
MGSIRSQYVKKIAVDLVNSRPDIFTDNFHENKKIVQGVIEGASKRDLNLISGYTTRYVIKKRNRAAKEAEFTGQTVE